MGIPSTTREAFAAVTACVKPKVGSLIVKGVLPSLLAIDKLVPFASLPAVAVTPRSMALILVAKVAYVSPVVVEMVVVTPLLVNVKLFAPSVSPAGISGEDHDVPVSFAEVIEKSAAVPDAFEMIASLDPVVSLTTVAVTPKSSPLIVVAKSFRVLTPAPVVIVAVAPAVVARVKEVAGSVAVALLSKSEYQAPVVARPSTTSVWPPVTAPMAAVAVTSLLEELTVRAARGPVREFSASKSVVIAVVAVCNAAKDDVWLESVVISAFQTSSGARSAAIAAATAPVTSMPGVVAPTVAARMELILTGATVDEVVDPRSVLTAETELIVLPIPLSSTRHR
jgi:hypothetical protein